MGTITADDLERCYENGVKAERERIFAILCHSCKKKMPVRKRSGPGMYQFEHLNPHGIPTTGCDASKVRESTEEGRA